MRSSSSSSTNSRTLGSKAQFLIITAVVIVSIFYLVSKWMQPYTIPDTSEIVLAEQPFVFDNVKEKALEVVNTSYSCEDLVNNLDEFKTYVDTFAFKKMIVYFDYTINTPCYAYDSKFPILVLFNIRIQSIGMTVSDKFFGFWPPGSGP